VLKDDGRNIKQALQGALTELLRMIGYDLGQELRATSLRVEKFLNKLGARLVEQWGKEIAGVTGGLALAAYVNHSVGTPAFSEKLPLHASEAQLNKSLGLFKSTKDFFEQDGKSKLRDELEKLLQEPVAGYLEQGKDLLATQFAKAFADIVAQERNRVLEQIEEYFTGVFAALDMTLDLDDLGARQKRIGDALQQQGK
jgi:hypothetical protein